METIKLKVLNQTGHTLMTCDADQAVSLVYTGAYQPGDRIAMEVEHPGQFCVIQFEDTMEPALVYVAQREINFYIPFGEQAITYSPKSFKGSRHLIRARLARPDELAVRRNLAFNCYDQHGDTGYYPHASANVETRGEAVFAARNAIDGIFENSSHGEYPYQSWGINRDPNAALTLDFGREVLLDELRITERADFPHDKLLDPGHRHLLGRQQAGHPPGQEPQAPEHHLPAAAGAQPGPQPAHPGRRAVALPGPDPDRSLGP